MAHARLGSHEETDLSRLQAEVMDLKGEVERLQMYVRTLTYNLRGFSGRMQSCFDERILPDLDIK